MLRVQDHLTVREAAELLGISTSSVHRLINEGAIPAKMPRGKTRGLLIEKAELERLGETYLQPYESPARS